MSRTRLHDELLDLIPPLRRYVSARVQTRHDVDDVVQETIARVLEAEDRLSPDSALAYAIVVARHVMADQATAADRMRRNQHRLIDLTQPERPDEQTLRSEEQAALREALSDIPPAHREALLAHVLGREPLAAAGGVPAGGSGSVAAQLSRLRARLRVDYVLALRGIELPTQRCRPVLLALSAADSRRQDTLRAGHHLLTCPTCSSVSEPLLERRSALAGILPWLGLGPAIELLRRLARQSWRPAAVAATTAASLGAVVLVAAVQARPEPPSALQGAPARAATSQPAAAPSAPAPSAPAPASVRLFRVSDGAPVTAGATLAAMVGDRIEARSVPVVAVVADEGFWIGDPDRGRVWVQLVRTGKESPQTVRAGRTVSFTGTVTAHDPGYARRIGVTPAEGAALLTRQAAHVNADDHTLTLAP